VFLKTAEMTSAAPAIANSTRATANHETSPKAGDGGPPDEHSHEHRPALLRDGGHPTGEQCTDESPRPGAAYKSPTVAAPPLKPGEGESRKTAPSAFRAPMAFRSMTKVPCSTGLPLGSGSPSAMSEDRNVYRLPEA